MQIKESALGLENILAPKNYDVLYDIFLYRSEAFPKQRKHFVDLVHSQRMLPLLEIPHKPETNAGSLCQLDLRKTVLLPFLLDIL